MTAVHLQSSTQKQPYWAYTKSCVTLQSSIQELSKNILKKFRVRIIPNLIYFCLLLWNEIPQGQKMTSKAFPLSSYTTFCVSCKGKNWNEELRADSQTWKGTKRTCQNFICYMEVKKKYIESSSAQVWILSPLKAWTLWHSLRCICM